MSVDRTQPLGAPIWFELATTGQEAAKTFYSDLMGWAVNDSPIDDGAVYSIFQCDGRDVAACCTMMADEIAQGLPPHWNVYFHVADCDVSAQRVRAAGGRVLVEPFEVMEHLRMAVVTDPEGAPFCLCQPRAHHGVGMIHELNSIGWVELATRNVARAEAFYRDVFGWSFADHPGGAPTVYRIFGVDGEDQGGLLQMTPEWGEMPSHWAIYLRVKDVDVALAKGQTLGGSVAVPAFDAPGVGRIAMMSDPAGAHAYLIALAGSS